MLDDAVAVVGMACRFPGAPDLESYWELLRQGRHAVAEVDGLDDWSRERARGLRHAALLDEVSGFDAAFFRISPREADSMDPQQRLLLELAWHALEDAGVVPASLRGGSVGVYVGISGSGYALQLAAAGGSGDATRLTGALCSIAANRLSYFLGVHGPSLAVDTACSSSLVAIHLACQALARGEADVALAGGVSLILDSFVSSTLTQAGVLSPEGRCKSFDAAADGYVRGEGAGMLALRPLAEARRAGDRIYAVIRGGAVNQDGPSNGLMAPNRAAQEMVLRAAYERSGVEASEVDYVEAHGTGTLLGDPIEAKALGAVVGRSRSPERPCRIGTSKTNIGHLEAAAGVAGVVKCCLMMHHQSYVPSLNYATPNPHIAFDRLHLEVQRRREPWRADHRSRLAGVSSFGIGGTNAHLVLESPAPLPAPQPATTLDPLLVVSAKSPAALRELRSAYAGCLRGEPRETLVDLCHAAATLRQHLPFRVAVPAGSVEEACRELEADRPDPRPAAKELGIAFLFTGQGSQSPGMGAELYRRAPLFRHTIDRCAEMVDGELGHSLVELLTVDEGEAIHETVFAQPAIFALEYALAQLWMSWGIEPAAVLGHSVGEIVAASVAGVLDLEDALRLVVGRGRIMQESAADGSMLAAELDEAMAIEIAAELQLSIDLAALNSPRQTVFSGRGDDLERLADRLGEVGILNQRLRVARAFHSALIEPHLPRYAELVDSVALRTPSIPFFSTVTGRRESEELTRAAYWVRQARSTVRFTDALGALSEAGFDALLEIGAVPTLLGLALETLGHEVLGLASLRPGRSAARQMVATLGGLFELGALPDWERFFGGAERRVRDLPAYPFQQARHWHEASGADAARLASPPPPDPPPEASSASLSASAPGGAREPARPLSWVTERLAVVTGHAVSRLGVATRLAELGFSSIDAAEVTALLARDLPAIADMELEWSDDTTVGDVLRWIEPHLGEADLDGVALDGAEASVAHGGAAPEGSETTVEIRLATEIPPSRGEPRNRVIDSITSDDGRLAARVVVDPEHSFFFDHPYDHVPGVLFVEAVQQLAESVAAILGGERLRRGLQLDDFHLRFESWGDLEAPLRITSESLTRIGDAWRLKGSILDVRTERRCVRFHGVLREAGLEAVDARPAPGASPADARLVHKQRAENVLISEFETTEEGAVATALPPAPGHPLRDRASRHVTLTQVVEWTRQLLTARAHAEEGRSFDERFILLSARIRFERPIAADQAVTLWAPALGSAGAGALEVGGTEVEVRLGAATAARVELLGAAADSESYERARWRSRR